MELGIALLLVALMLSFLVVQQRRGRGLKDAAARYRVFYEAAPVAIVVSDHLHRVLDWNNAAEKLFGWPRKEVLGRDFLDLLVSKPALVDFQDAVTRTMQTTSVTTTLTQNLRRDGSVLLCDWRHAVIGRGASDQVVVSMALDVTDARNTQAALRKSERRFRSLAETTNDIIWTADLHGRFTYVSPSVKEQTGFSVKEVMQITVADCLAAPDARRMIEEELEHLRHHGKLRRSRFELEQRRQDGGTDWVDIVMDLLESEPGQSREIVGITRKVTAQRELREALAARVAAIEEAAEGVSIRRTDGVVEYVNPAYERLTGYSAEELVGHPFHVVGDEEAREKFYGEMLPALERGETWRGEMSAARRDGERYIAAVTVSPIHTQDDQIVRLVSIVRDVTEERHMAQELERRAHYDELTGLPNRGLFFDRLHERIRQARRAGEGLALLFMDLDGFKVLNDTHGHQAGDRALKEVARRFGTTLRESDTLARVSGDEFAVLLGPMARPEHAGQVASKLLACLEAPLDVTDGAPAVLGVSIGISRYPEDAEAPELLLKRADEAMYAAKQAGRNRYHFHGESDETQKVAKPAGQLE